MSRLHVQVDPLECEANGVCTGIAPDVFELSDDDELYVLQPDPPPELHDQVRDAVQNCPKRALSLREDDA